MEAFAASANETAQVVVVGVFEDDEHAEAFLAMAEGFQYPVRFGVVTSRQSEALAPLGITQDELATLASSDEDNKDTKDGAAPAAALEAAAAGGGGDGGGASLVARAFNTIVLFKPYDEGRVATRLEKPLEGSKKSKLDMAEMMHKMMGVPQDEAMKLIPENKETKALKQWIT